MSPPKWHLKQGWVAGSAAAPTGWFGWRNQEPQADHFRTLPSGSQLGPVVNQPAAQRLTLVGLHDCNRFSLWGAGCGLGPISLSSIYPGRTTNLHVRTTSPCPGKVHHLSGPRRTSRALLKAGILHSSENLWGTSLGVCLVLLIQSMVQLCCFDPINTLFNSLTVLWLII